jgi:hypothetical protein
MIACELPKIWNSSDMFWKDIVDEGLLLVLKLKKKKTIESKNYDILPVKHKCIGVAFLSSCNICYAL